MKTTRLRPWILSTFLALGLSQVSSAVDMAALSPSKTGSSPSVVDGLACVGSKTKAVRVSVKDSSGRIKTEPMVAVLRSPTWSPDDAQRDGASEFEVLMCAARLLKNNQLPGIVGIGNSRGVFLPATEVALQRIVQMGVPVVRLANRGQLRSFSGDLFIEGGSLNADEARAMLAECLLRHGSLAPVNNPDKPTEAELTAIREKIALYQASFDSRTSMRMASTHSKIGDWSCSEG